MLCKLHMGHKEGAWVKKEWKQRHKRASIHVRTTHPSDMSTWAPSTRRTRVAVGMRMDKMCRRLHVSVTRVGYMDGMCQCQGVLTVGNGAWDGIQGADSKEWGSGWHT